MPNFRDLTGQRFGRLTVLSVADKYKHGGYQFLCRCDCGKEKVIRGNYLLNGTTKSCRCLASKNHTTHGMRKHHLYPIWVSMNQRCKNPSNHAFNRYGGRGIKVCDRWRNSFENFLADMGERPSPQHTIERIDNNKGYSKANCIWATRTEQQNNRRNNTFIEVHGQRKTLPQWAKYLNMSCATLAGRIYRNKQRRKQDKWPLEKIFSPTNYKFKQVA